MKNRWQKSLDAAVAAYDTPMPWARVSKRKEMITRRVAKTEKPREIRRLKPRAA